MAKLPCWAQAAFWVFAFDISLFYAWFAWDIHVWPTEVGRKARENMNRGHWLHGLWFNFAGSFVGWCAVWVMNPAAYWAGVPVDATWGSAALAGVAFAGITGHLPQALHSIVLGLAGLIALLSNVMKEALQRFYKAQEK